MNKYSFKIIVVGFPKVGLTSFLYSGGFHDYTFFNAENTMGVCFNYEKFRLNNDEKVSVQIWGLKANFKFIKLIPFYCKGAKVCILCFDLSNYESFKSLPIFIKTIRKIVNKIPIYLVGTKSDLKNVVHEEQILELINAYNIKGYYTTSIFDQTKKRIILRELTEYIVKDTHEKLNDFSNISSNSLKESLNRLKEKIIDLGGTEDCLYIRLSEVAKIKYEKYANLFNQCPLCKSSNETYYIQNRIFNNKNELFTEAMFKLLEKYDNNKYPLVNNISLGLLCCDCFKKILKN